MDDDANQEPDDLLTLLVGQTGIQAGADLGEEVTGLLGHDLGTWSLYGVEAGL